MRVLICTNQWRYHEYNNNNNNNNNNNIFIIIVTFMQDIYNYIPERISVSGYITLQLFCIYNTW